MRVCTYASSSIGMMASGTLRCLGTPMHLKAKFGSGYTLKVSFQMRNEDKATRFIRELLPSATLLDTFAGAALR